ncbi:MAG: SDR family oxidoreductase [Proteobacteria bacterium]|nr:SDR family oxidoreductase [Pseudomonadota bacterium]
MKVFITGATGFIGTALTKDLVAHGHSVLGLARSEEGALALGALGAEPHRGSLEDLERLKRGVTRADAVVHLAFNHDFSTYMKNCADDRTVIDAIGSVLGGRPLLVTSGTGMARFEPGQPATEDAPAASSAVIPRAASEEGANAITANGGNAGIVRLPQVHDTRRQGLVSFVIQTALEKRVLAYLGDGANRWPAAHVSDVARLYRLAIERAEKGAVYNAVAEEGVSMRAIADTLGNRLGLPVKSITPDEAPEYFGVMAMFAAMDSPASSAITRKKLDWNPTGPGLLADLEKLELPETMAAT